MKVLLIFVLFFASPLIAEGPQFQHKDPYIQQEFENAYQDIRSILGFTLPSLTLTQINATVVSPGTLRYCTNCTTDAVCVSTAAAINSFARLSVRTTACN